MKKELRLDKVLTEGKEEVEFVPTGKGRSRQERVMDQ